MTNREYIGEKINEWKILDFKQDEHGGKWLCECKCGEQKWQKVYNIKNGKSKMCAKCSGKSRRKPKEERKIRIRFDSNKGWEEENVFEGTYKEYLEEFTKGIKEYAKKIQTIALEAVENLKKYYEQFINDPKVAQTYADAKEKFAETVEKLEDFTGVQINKLKENMLGSSNSLCDSNYYYNTQ